MCRTQRPQWTPMLPCSWPSRMRHFSNAMRISVSKVSIPKLHSIRMKNHYNVEWIGGPTRLNIDPQTVLLAALNNRLQNVVIMGTDREGYEYFAGNLTDGKEILWLLERCKRRLMNTADMM